MSIQFFWWISRIHSQLDLDKFCHLFFSSPCVNLDNGSYQQQNRPHGCALICSLELMKHDTVVGKIHYHFNPQALIMFVPFYPKLVIYFQFMSFCGSKIQF